MSVIRRRVLCIVVVLAMLLGTAFPVFSKDLFLKNGQYNYCDGLAQSQTQCKNAYKYFSTVIDHRYLPKVYDLFYKAQYRLSVFGGSNWKYLNEGDYVTKITDSVLGTFPIGSAKGCNSYARFAIQYIRGQQGVLVRASDYLGKQKTYVPSAAEIKRFIEAYADVGERILTGYYNSEKRKVHPHSLVFLCEDADKDGFYFLCQDGDGNGQTLRYYSYAYMATRLRYYEDYGYALGIGDTNRGKDAVRTEKIIGKVTSVSPTCRTFSAQDGFTMQLIGWALAKDCSTAKIVITADEDSRDLGQIKSVSDPDIAAIYPGWCTGNTVGFNASVDLSVLYTGYHDLHIIAQAGQNSEELETIRVYVANNAYKLENPKEPFLFVRQGTQDVSVRGWYYDRSGKDYALTAELMQNNTVLSASSLTAVDRPDVAVSSSFARTDIGFEGSLLTGALPCGEYTVRITANCAGSLTRVEQFPLYIIRADSPVVPYQFRIISLPKTTLQFKEPFRSDGLKLSVLYTDGHTENVTTDIVCSDVDSTLIGQQTVQITYGGLTESLTVQVLPPITPTGLTISVESSVLVKGKRETVAALVAPTDCTYYRIDWTSVNPRVASVDESGVITALKSGETEISATLYDYYGQVCDRKSVSVKVRSSFDILMHQFFEKILRFFGIKIVIN